MASTSPTQRTLKYLREEMNYTAQVVERWNMHARKRIDLFGVIDVVAVGGRIVGVQACAGSSHAARRDKAIAEPRLREWLKAGGEFLIISWSKRGAAKKRKVWTPRVDRLTLDDLNPE